MPVSVADACRHGRALGGPTAVTHHRHNAALPSGVAVKYRRDLGRSVRAERPTSIVAAATIARALSQSPARTSSRSGPSSSAAQSTESLRRPAQPEALPCLAEQFGHGARLLAALGGQTVAQPRRERRAETAGRHGDGHRTVAVHRREDEGGMGAVIGAVDPDPRRLRVVVHRAVDVGPAGRGHDEPESQRRRRWRTARRSTCSSSVGERLHLVGSATGRSPSPRAPHSSRVRALRAATRPPPDHQAGAPGDVEGDRVEGGGRRCRVSHGAAAGRPCPPRSSRSVSSSIRTKLPVMRSVA